MVPYRRRTRALVKYAPRKRAYARRPANTRTGGYIGLELKFNDTENTGENVGTGWTNVNPAAPNCISAVAQGDGPSDRDGRVYHIKSLHVHGTMLTDQHLLQGAPLSDIYCRIAIVWDKQTNGAAFDPDDVFETTSTDPLFARRKLENSKRFTVLYDKNLVLRRTETALAVGNSNTFSYGVRVTPFTFNKFFKRPIKVNTNGTTKTIGVMTDNSIHVIAVSTAGSAATQITYNTRIRFCG